LLLTRLYLRNFRVFEDELDLALPPGLVGIFGPNGSGKSTLLESILWTLWGRARTAKEEIRSAGVGAECVTEVEFEHEGHLYVARRSIAGAAATVRAEAHCDGLIMSEGVRDTARYLHAVLGMDDGAFRASVFAEQKQLAAFSSQTPAERRRLVLQLLGITPLDAARDAARRDAKATADQHLRLRAVLPDLDALRVSADDAEARAAAAEADAAQEQQAATAARGRAGAATDEFHRLDVVRQEWDGLVIEGRAAKATLDGAVEAVATLHSELATLDEQAAELAVVEPASSGLADAERRLRLVEAVATAARARDGVVVPAEPAPPAEEAHRAATARAQAAREDLAGIDGRRRGAEGELARAEDHAARSAGLSGEADCPLCGQELGSAFERVQAHRATEVDQARGRLQALSVERAEAEREAGVAVAALQRAQAQCDDARRAQQVWARAAERRGEAVASLDAAVAALAGVDPSLAGALVATHTDAAATVDADTAVAAADALGAEVGSMRFAKSAADRLRGCLERRPVALAACDQARQRAADAEDRVSTLRDKVRALGFDRAALDEAETASDETVGRADAADRQAHSSRLVAAEERARAESEARHLVDAKDQHAQLAQLETDARHLTRLAELISAFRNTVVASVGPRLAVQAAELFGELTDNEYDQLEVDPETFQLRISDAGRSYGLERFSGSEVDLANLALRVAISEHVRFQSGGSVGLLVLDEVFGPLDEDRKAKMLLALERLRGRFRQILVVTHASEIKEQLPSAVEVVKRPNRRATARLLNA